MAVDNDNVELQFLAVVAAVPIDVDIKCYAKTDVYVYYGNARLVAVQDVDFTVTLNTVDYDTFTVTPTASLITKIDAQIVADPTDINVIHVRRELGFTSDFLATQAFLREKIALEFDKTMMRAQQILNQLNRSLRIPENDVLADIPVLSARKGMVLEFHPDTGEPITINSIQGLISGELNATAFAVAFTPYLTITSVNLQYALQEVYDEVAAAGGLSGKLRASTNDTTPSWLGGKLAVSGSLLATIGNPAGNEYVALSANLATTPEAQAGTEVLHLMTPALVKAEIDAFNTAARGSSKVLLDEKIAVSGDTYITFSQIFVSALYDMYEFEVFDLTPTTDDKGLYIQVGTGATPTWVANGCGGSALDMTAGSASSDNNISVMYITRRGGGGFAPGNGNGEGYSGVVLAYEPASAVSAGYKRFNWQGMTSRSDNVQSAQVGGGSYSSSTVFSSLRFGAETGTLKNGRVRVWGRKIA